jgi:hypothetical protein
MNETQMSFGALMAHVLQSESSQIINYSSLLGGAEGLSLL